MRWLKKLLTWLLLYIAVYLPFVVIVQALTGYDYTAAYSVGGIVGCVELVASAVIKLIEIKKEKASKKDAESKGIK